MLASPLTLSPLQYRLLRELDLSDLPDPDAGPASFEARGLDAAEVRESLPALLWAGLVARKDGGEDPLTLTPTGSATLRAAECDELAARLGAVASFATTVARGTAPRRAGHALQRLAAGAWTLEQAEEYVRTD